MKQFLRLVRYGLPYWLQMLPGVLLLAMVGLLDTFRILLLQPIFDQVLDPHAPEGPITLCDSTGTYLVNYAGFGTIMDLRNQLYEATMRRSSSFFHKHATGTILSTLINDVDRVQNAVSTVISEFLQQFFTFVVGLFFVI